eukprot:755738-Hanusia_phi.AAC.1
MGALPSFRSPIDFWTWTRSHRQSVNILVLMLELLVLLGKASCSSELSGLKATASSDVKHLACKLARSATNPTIFVVSSCTSERDNLNLSIQKNLDFELTEKDLLCIFEQFGSVKKVSARLFCHDHLKISLHSYLSHEVVLAQGIEDLHSLRFSCSSHACSASNRTFYKYVDPRSAVLAQDNMQG